MTDWEEVSSVSSFRSFFGASSLLSTAEFTIFKQCHPPRSPAVSPPRSVGDFLALLGFCLAFMDNENVNVG